MMRLYETFLLFIFANGIYAGALERLLGNDEAEGNSAGSLVSDISTLIDQRQSEEQRVRPRRLFRNAPIVESGPRQSLSGQLVGLDRPQLTLEPVSEQPKVIHQGPRLTIAHVPEKNTVVVHVKKQAGDAHELAKKILMQKLGLTGEQKKNIKRYYRNQVKTDPAELACLLHAQWLKKLVQKPKDSARLIRELDFNLDRNIWGKGKKGVCACRIRKFYGLGRGQKFPTNINNADLFRRRVHLRFMLTKCGLNNNDREAVRRLLKATYKIRSMNKFEKRLWIFRGQYMQLSKMRASPHMDIKMRGLLDRMMERLQIKIKLFKKRADLEKRRLEIVKTLLKKDLDATMRAALQADLRNIQEQIASQSKRKMRLVGLAKAIVQAKTQMADLNKMLQSNLINEHMRNALKYQHQKLAKHISDLQKQETLIKQRMELKRLIRDSHCSRLTKMALETQVKNIDKELKQLMKKRIYISQLTRKIRWTKRQIQVMTQMLKAKELTDYLKKVIGLHITHLRCKLRVLTRKRALRHQIKEIRRLLAFGDVKTNHMASALRNQLATLEGTFKTLRVSKECPMRVPTPPNRPCRAGFGLAGTPGVVVDALSQAASQAVAMANRLKAEAQMAIARAQDAVNRARGNASAEVRLQVIQLQEAARQARQRAEEAMRIAEQRANEARNKVSTAGTVIGAARVARGLPICDAPPVAKYRQFNRKLDRARKRVDKYQKRYDDALKSRKYDKIQKAQRDLEAAKRERLQILHEGPRVDRSSGKSCYDIWMN